MQRTVSNIPLKTLSLLQRNPRKIQKDQMQKLVNSIRDDPDFLWNRPVLVNKVDDEYTVYAGNQRVRAAMKLKMKHIPCIIEDNLDEKILKERILKDNKTYGDFDYDILANEYDIDMLFDAGFTASDLQIDARIEDLGSEDGEKETPKKCKNCPNCGHEL